MHVSGWVYFQFKNQRNRTYAQNKTSKEKDNTVYFLTLIRGLPNETLG